MSASLIDPATIDTRSRGLGYEDDTVVLVHRGTWTVGHTPVTGIRLEGRLDGNIVDQAGVPYADWDDEEVEEAARRLKLEIVAAAGLVPIHALRRRIEETGDPQDLIAKDPDLRRYIKARMESDQASAEDTELRARVEQLEADLADLRRQYRQTRWLLLAHLYRHGMPESRIAAVIGVHVESVERCITCVTVNSAALVLGIKDGTWRGYVSRGQAPAPDDHIGAEPVWHLRTVLAHQENRHGKVGRPAGRTRG